jgi:hypothetical protein
MKQILLALCLIPLLLSCGKQSKLPEIPGVDGPKFNVLNGMILIGIRLENLNIPMGGKVPIPKTDNSHAEASPALEGGTLLQITIDPKDIEKLSSGVEFGDPETLPGGRPLPGIVGGVLPSLAVNVPDLFDTTFYVSNKVFGFFVPVEIPSFDVDVTTRIVINGKAIGNLSVISPDQNRENSGLLLLLNISALRSPELKRLINLSKSEQFKNTVF